MKTVNAILALLLALFLFMLMILLIVNMPASRKMYVDCSMSSFHPDYNAAMRKACQERAAK
jgi:recombinational DNA repair ATPase RecF